MLRGNVEFVIDGQKRIVEAGELCIINSGVIHSGRDTGKKEKVELITILWEYEFFLKYCKDLPISVMEMILSGRYWMSIDQRIQKDRSFRLLSAFTEVDGYMVTKNAISTIV